MPQVLRRHRRSWAVLVAVAGLIAACGTPANDDNASPAATATPGSSAATAAVPLDHSSCDQDDISRDLGVRLTVVRCRGDWAYVSAGGPGDAQALLRRVDGSWTRYSDFPASICKDEAAAGGVPTEELSGFPAC